MSEHTPLTEAEREALRDACNLSQRNELVMNVCAVVERILAARMSTATADDGQECVWASSGQAHRRYCPTATADTGLRERVEALADDLTAEVEELRADIPPMGPSRVAHMYRTAGLSDARDRLRNALDATAAPTTDTGARDE